MTGSADPIRCVEIAPPSFRELEAFARLYRAALPPGFGAAWSVSGFASARDAHGLWLVALRDAGPRPGLVDAGAIARSALDLTGFGSSPVLGAESEDSMRASRLADQLVGFACLRCVGPEAELLALARAPSVAGRGVGARLLGLGLYRAYLRGVSDVFLEVAVENSSARHIYAAAGFQEAGRRLGYYREALEGPGDALILSKTLTKV